MLDALSFSKQYGSPIIPKLCNMRAVAFLSDGTRRGDQLMKYSSFCSKRKTKVFILNSWFDCIGSRVKGLPKQARAVVQSLRCAHIPERRYDIMATA